MLILGGNGFIGSHLVDRLLHEGHRIRVFDRYEEHYRKPISGVEYCAGDFGNRGMLSEALSGMDMVFHLISTTLPKTSNDDPAFDVQSNVIETIFMLEQCVANHIRKVVFISSGGAIYGNPANLPITENSSTEPECSYGITKLTIEKYFSLFHHLHGLNYIILRPSNPYGSRQNPDGIQGAISVFLGRIAQGKSIEIWGDGNVIRDYIFIEDLIDGIYKAASSCTRSKIFNLGSGVGHSLNEIVDVMRRVTGRQIQVVYQARRSFDIPCVYLDIARAKKELSWEPAVSLETGIEKTWNFVRNLYQ